MVALGSSLAGGGLTGWATFSVSKRQERAALAREVREHLGRFAGALIIAVAYIRDVPPNAPEFGAGSFVPAFVKEKMPDGFSRWTAAYRWVSTQQRMRRVLGDRPFLYAERVVLAAAPLRVFPLPPALRQVIDDTLDYVIELSEERSDELKSKWPEVHLRFYSIVQASVADADDVLRALGRPVPDTPTSGGGS
jgi:hypothetical protein